LKILQISYYFPPMGGAGVQRGLKFARYLPLHGVRPVVLSAADPHYVQDTSLLAEVPQELEVYRVAHSPWLARMAARRRTGTAAAPEAATPAPVSSAWRARLRDMALRWVRSWQFPDDAAPWGRAARVQARAVIREHAARGEPFDLIFSSSPPPSAHALGWALARDSGLPWVADFRDLWTDNPAYDAPGWRRAFDLRTEQHWLERADGIVTVTPSWRDMLARRRGQGLADVAFIPNGYDEDDFARLPEAQVDPGTFTLVHTGTFYGPRDPAGLLAGLARYLEGPRDGHPALRVRLVGNMGARFAQALQDFELRHPGVVRCLPYLPHAQALGELMAADALLLVVGGGKGPGVRGWLPGKIFEYLRSGRPVVTIGDPSGDAAGLIREHAFGPVVAEGDAAGLADALARLLSAAPARRPPSPSVAAFERRALAGQLAAYLHRVVERHRAVRAA